MASSLRDRPTYLGAVARADNFQPISYRVGNGSSNSVFDLRLVPEHALIRSPFDDDGKSPCIPFHLTLEDYLRSINHTSEIPSQEQGLNQLDDRGITPVGWLRPRVVKYLQRLREANTPACLRLISGKDLQQAGCWKERKWENDEVQIQVQSEVFVAVLEDDVWKQGIQKVTEEIGKTAQRMKDDGVFKECLDGWRDELYEIYGDLNSSYFDHHGTNQTEIESNIAFSCERAACAVFGFATFGVHMTAYEGEGFEMKIWVPRRSTTKPTWPGMLDNSVAGGIPSGMTPFECMIKECHEEASLPDEFVRKRLKQTGVTTYFYVTSEGWLQPEIEYIYDLPLPDAESSEYIKPQPLDGEVESFSLMPVQDLMQKLREKPSEIKPNCGLIMVDFLVRHGFITVETDPNFIGIVSKCHRPLYQVPMPVRDLRPLMQAGSTPQDARDDADKPGLLKRTLQQTTKSAMLVLTVIAIVLACVTPVSASLASQGTSDGHTNNWAVLVCASRYRTVKRLGIPDSHIILMLADDVACDARNEFPGTVYANSGRQLDLYGSGVDEIQGKDNGIGVGVEVDYRGYEVTVTNFLRLLTGHGGNEFLKFQDNEEVSSHDIGDAISQMWEKKRYNRMMLMYDTCQANTLYSQIRSPNIIATGSSELGEDSLSHHNDPDIGVAVIDSFTHYVLQYLEGIHSGSQATMQDFFDMYDPAKIQSHPGIRTDLFPFSLNETLLTDFFGGVSDIELDEDSYSIAAFSARTGVTTFETHSKSVSRPGPSSSLGAIAMDNREANKAFESNLDLRPKAASHGQLFWTTAAAIGVFGAFYVSHMRDSRKY